jgi:cytosine/adenosine deaminase-related metal-dependent hydrolase
MDGRSPDRADQDLFPSAYLAGVTSSLVAGVGDGTGRRVGGHDGDRDSPAKAVTTRPGAATAGSVAIGGQILTEDGPLRGWVTVEDGVVSAITTRKPAGPKALTTRGVVSPGLIDLHGHPEFNVFAPWEPPKSFVNRYAWRDSDAYRSLIRDPQNRLLGALPAGTQLRYAEIRALVGGVTAIQGASLRTQGKAESLVRNVDGVVFGEHRARSLVDLPSSLTSRGGDDLARILDGITAGEVDAFYVHLAEGRRDNERSVGEFDHLVGLGALTNATVVIHGTAMTREQLGAAKDAGAKLVWSPQSNLRLYGETTHVVDALDVGMPVALGADWLPSGSTSLLAELKVAREELANQGRQLDAAELLAMVTSHSAAVAGLEDRLGSIAVGRPADLVVLARQDADPYESVCASTPDDVELVLIGGDIVYGTYESVTALAADPTDPALEPVLAWGRHMLLDTGYDAGDAVPGSSPRLEQLRASLTSTYPPVGPIWA